MGWPENCILWHSLSAGANNFISRQESNPKLYMKQQISPNTSSPARETNIVHFKEICLEVVSETCKILFCKKPVGAKRRKRRRTESYDEIQGVLSPKCNKDSTEFIVVVVSRHCQSQVHPPNTTHRPPPTTYSPTD